MYYNISIIKEFWLKHKRVILICFAVLFLVVLFLAKNTSVFKNTVNFVKGEDGLTYDTIAIGDLVNKDTDGDGILDWEEHLWGLDPTKAETTPGIPDSSVIKKLKAEQGLSANGLNEGDEGYTENLTETEKFSREFFSTIVTLNQNGVMDEEMMERISNSLSEHIQNPITRKIFSPADIKTVNGNSYQDAKNYADALNNAYLKNPISGKVFDILEKFIIDENNVDESVLVKLDPIIKQTNNLIEAILKINVPESLVLEHLEFLNALERVVENTEDIRLYSTDIILSLGGISQYDKNITLLDSSLENLSNAITKILNN